MALLTEQHVAGGTRGLGLLQVGHPDAQGLARPQSYHLRPADRQPMTTTPWLPQGSYGDPWSLPLNKWLKYETVSCPSLGRSPSASAPTQCGLLRENNISAQQAEAASCSGKNTGGQGA